MPEASGREGRAFFIPRDNEGVIHSIIFDLGRVLIPFDFDRAYRQMTARCGLSTDQIRARLHAAGIVPEYESGRIESRDFVAQVGKILDIALSYEEFCEIWSSIFLPETLVPESFIQALRRRYRMVLLSNTNDIHYTMLERRYPILSHFDAYTLSHKVGAMKPEPAIYADAVGKAQCAPGECFFTDDMPEYVEGARRFGIDAVRFEGYEPLQQAMRTRGIEWD
ncbi:MAG: HAD family phosphatase [Bryobacteraceae bacterium]|nr:HAD family phosphatase [Solibacteraceae bacterium]MCO5351573.1 HAD family phosphatase [Bryobacteraceae bacterium]